MFNTFSRHEWTEHTVKLLKYFLWSMINKKHQSMHHQDSTFSHGVTTNTHRCQAKLWSSRAHNRVAANFKSDKSNIKQTKFVFLTTKPEQAKTTAIAVTTLALQFSHTLFWRRCIMFWIVDVCLTVEIV